MDRREAAATLLRRSLDSAPRALRPTPLTSSREGSPSSPLSSADNSPMSSAGGRRVFNSHIEPSSNSGSGNTSMHGGGDTEPPATSQGLQTQEQRARANSEDYSSRRPDLTLPAFGHCKNLRLTKNSASVRDLAPSPSSSRGDAARSSASPPNSPHGSSGGSSPGAALSKPFPFSPKAKEMWSSYFTGQERARSPFCHSAVLAPTFVGQARDGDVAVADEDAALPRSYSGGTNTDSSGADMAGMSNCATAGTAPGSKGGPSIGAGLAAWQRLRVQATVVAHVRMCGKQLDAQWDVGQLTQELRQRLEAIGPESAEGFVPSQSSRLKLVREAQGILVNRLPCFADLLHLVREEYENAFALAVANEREATSPASRLVAGQELDRLRREHKAALKELRAARLMLEEQKRVQRDAEMEAAREMLLLTRSLADSYSNVRDLLMMLNAVQQGRVNIRTLNVNKAIELLACSQERQRQLGVKYAKSRVGALDTSCLPMEEDFDDLLTARTDDFDDFMLDEYMIGHKPATTPLCVPALDLSAATNAPKGLLL